MKTSRIYTVFLGLGLLSWSASTTDAQVNHSSFIAEYEGAATCLECHGPGSNNGDEGAEVTAMIHWTWHTTDVDTGQPLGKKNVINNYCIAVSSNEPRCTSCHIGIGWKDNTFDFTNQGAIDCLVCHDNTKTYKKTKTGAGAPDPTVDLLAVAKSVGPTSRQTCGSCHFNGGGGAAVKHGDLDPTLLEPTRDLDVHMGVDGANKSCSFCHAPGESSTGLTTTHTILGSRYTSTISNQLSCTDCHADPDPPHDPGTNLGQRLNTHTERVSCQTCHIPSTARGGMATKMTWDWSTAGEKNPDGSIKILNDENGDPIYDTRKGSFTWESNIIPEYRWFNGRLTFISLDDTVSSNSVAAINQLDGNKDDPTAKIYPVKRFTGRQPYDAGVGTLAVPNLFPSTPENTTAYWKFYDWSLALQGGQAAVGRQFSGELGWVETEMFWIQNHMVAPKEMALHCTDCHSPRGQLSFAALGYDAQEAVELQNLAGFEIRELQAAPEEGGTAVVLVWTMTPGHTYQVQYSDNLNAWTEAENGFFTAGETPTEQTWTATGEAAGARYYKILRERP